MNATPEETTLGGQYRCERCAAQFLVTRPGQMPTCCQVPLRRM